LLSESRDLLDIYLAGSTVEKIFQEVSCGDVGLEGVKVIVPQERYETMLRRFGLPAKGYHGMRESIDRFLAHRCDKAFLEFVIGRTPQFLSSLRLRSFLDVISDADLVARLHAFGLLPESERLRHVAELRSLAVGTPDAGFITEKVGDILTSEERDRIVAAVRDELLPDLAREIDTWEDNHDGKEDPASYFYRLQAALKQYREMLSHDALAVRQIESGLKKVEKSVNNLWSHMPPEREYDRDDYEPGIRGAVSDDGRSVFDDVDE
jgi:hypothetical protein